MIMAAASISSAPKLTHSSRNLFRCSPRRSETRCHAEASTEAVLSRRTFAAGAAALAAALALTMGAPAPSQATGLRAKGSPVYSPGDEVGEKYLSALEKKKLGNARRKAALAKKREEVLGAPAIEAKK